MLLLIAENFFSRLISFCINRFSLDSGNLSFLFKKLYISLMLYDLPFFSYSILFQKDCKYTPVIENSKHYQQK